MSQLAVFGAPIAHSLSPQIHLHFASQEGREISYEKILVENNFSSLLSSFFAQGGIGCNVTVPCKLEAYELADHLTKRAQIAHAVNTIKFEDGKLLGDNTDGFGFYTDIVRLGCKLEGAKILIIGAGGATHGILPPLLSQELGVKHIVLTNRTLEHAKALVSTFADVRLSAVDLSQVSGDFDVVINATSMSMYGLIPALPDSIFKAHFVYDLYYTPQGTTVFTEKAKALGCSNCFDGLGMLVGQAALAYELWFGFMPDIALTIEHMRGILQQR